MGRYIIKRLLVAIPVFLCITLVVYILISLAPTTIVDVISATSLLTQEEYAALTVKYSLDKPILTRYCIWLWDFVRGDWGESYTSFTPVIQLIGERIKPSLLLSLSGMFIGMLIGIPLGILSGYKPNSVWDHFSSALCSFCSAFPVFFLALLMMYVFCVKLPWFPTYGMYSSSDVRGLGDLMHHLALPVTVVAMQSFTGYIKQTRCALMEVVHEEYVKTARSKGISERAVVVKHAFRNSLAPIITSVALSIPHLVAGSVVTEQIFSWPGMGSLMIASISNRDYPVIMGITVLIAIAVLVSGLIADILYAAADPRVSFK